MKIRIKGSSIRLRLTQSEVELFGRSGRVQERVEFGEGSLVYSLEKGSGDKLTAVYEGDNIKVFFPESKIGEWVDTEMVGLNSNQDETNNNVHILVEKDYQCLMPRRSEDETDNYPNPLAEKIA